MHMPPPSAQETARAIELGHEPSTISVKGVTWSLVIFFAFAAVVHVIIWEVYHQLENYEHNQNVARSALTKSAAVHPPEPRLQPTMTWHETTEPEDLLVMRGRENTEFVHRGWVNEQSKEPRVPDDIVKAIADSGGAPISATPSDSGTGAGTAK